MVSSIDFRINEVKTIEFAVDSHISINKWDINYGLKLSIVWCLNDLKLSDKLRKTYEEFALVFLSWRLGLVVVWDGILFTIMHISLMHIAVLVQPNILEEWVVIPMETLFHFTEKY